MAEQSTEDAHVVSSNLTLGTSCIYGTKIGSYAEKMSPLLRQGPIEINNSILSVILFTNISLYN